MVALIDWSYAAPIFGAWGVGLILFGALLWTIDRSHQRHARRLERSRPLAPVVQLDLSRTRRRQAARRRSHH